MVRRTLWRIRPSQSSCASSRDLFGFLPCAAGGNQVHSRRSWGREQVLAECGRCHKENRGWFCCKWAEQQLQPRNPGVQHQQQLSSIVFRVPWDRCGEQEWAMGLSEWDHQRISRINYVAFDVAVLCCFLPIKFSVPHRIKVLFYMCAYCIT